MTGRLLDEQCPLCAEADERCPLCEAQMDMSQEEAMAAEGLRLALCFAEFGYVPEMRLEPERTLPLGWRAEFLLMGRIS